MDVPFIWPGVLWGLLLVPLVLASYIRLRRQGRRVAVLHPNTALAARAQMQGRRITRHLPPILLLLALTAAVLAAARPVLVLPLPANRAAVILAIDSSGSMRSQDIQPSRLDAAKEAAKSFVRTVPGGVRVGLVMFGGYAQLVVPPTTERELLLEAIGALSFIRRTAIGEGLLEAVAALPERSRPTPHGLIPPPAGPRPPGIVILLSDGRSNTGIDPLEAAQIAHRQEVTVYTVGVGQPYTPDNVWTLGGSLDEETLKQIARITGGTYHHASSAEGLRDVYQKLARAVGWERRPQEAGALGAALAVGALISALVLSLLVTSPLGF
ncbi:MAG: VWA domain-containing protein [Armatimonadota bacterium]|nr:VWA domain-containing protein [Armatimonadota bacterium]MDR7427612.1 VWA domain-containing protein [Armatimonadota bacterium]MDR7469580.1 VWA domain-containing protein [Armatimonadota bacterium]MDR7475833.1 VWA domain-containing protein [Armatimonadota bacterium]MDR7538300.1 VWA domain-containing protein [Armatimonadota bacterium]